jgi:FkbM family methyltransferase
MQVKSYMGELNRAWEISANALEFCKIASWTSLYHLGNKWTAFNSKALRRANCLCNGQKITVALRQSGGDIFTLDEVIAREAYRLPTLNSLKIETIVDLGANIGLTSLYYATLFPNARLFCIEPEPDNFNLLKLNCEQNGFQWTCIQQAIGDKQGKAKLLRNEFANQHSLVSGDSNKQDAVEVEVGTMPSLIDSHQIEGIDLLKVDIEGAEESLFAQCSSWISSVRIIIIEIHPPLVDYNNVINSITKHGFHYFKANSLFPDSMDIFVRNDVVDDSGWTKFVSGQDRG